jgi:hypothetical protein
VTVAGRFVFVSDSNRFAGAARKAEWLSVIDPATNRVVGNVPAGRFPRDLSATADGRTVLVANFQSSSLQLVDVARLTPAYFAEQKRAHDADIAEQNRIRGEREARIAAGQSAPGAEEKLRRFIAGLQSGMPTYEDLFPNLANNMRNNIDRWRAQAESWGALKSITLVSITPDNADVFEAQFEKAKIRFMFMTQPDGKIGPMGFGPVQ